MSFLLFAKMPNEDGCKAGKGNARLVESSELVKLLKKKDSDKDFNFKLTIVSELWRKFLKKSAFVKLLKQFTTVRSVEKGGLTHHKELSTKFTSI